MTDSASKSQGTPEATSDLSLNGSHDPIKEVPQRNRVSHSSDLRHSLLLSGISSKVSQSHDHISVVSKNIVDVLWNVYRLPGILLCALGSSRVDEAGKEK